MDDKQIDELLSKLDDIARDYNHHDYGLPLHDDECRSAMRKAVRTAASLGQEAKHGTL